MKHFGGYQRGIGIIGLIILVGLLGFFTLVAFKLLPVYLENFKVTSVLNSLDDEPQITQKSKREIQKILQRRFEVNDVEHVSSKNIEVDSQPGRLHVAIRYEVRVPLLANLDVVARFDDAFETVAH